MAFHDPNARCLPVCEWPQQDGSAWARAQAPADIFDPSVGYAQRWKPSTRQQIENGYGGWLGWLSREGLLDAAAAPGERATPERVRQYLDHLEARGLADNTRAGRLQQLCQGLRAMAPQVDWSWIHLASSRLYAHAVLVRDPVERMQPPEAIIGLGEDMMRAAVNDRFRTPCDRATLFRDGLMLAFLVHRPYRLANLTSLTLGEHVEEIAGEWWVNLPEAETKNGEISNGPWPKTLVGALVAYLSVHRPVLLKGSRKADASVQALWISRQGGAMGSDAIAYQIKARTEEEFGVAINPHTFRHIATTTTATWNPDGMATIRGVLGHRSITTSEKYYNRAGMIGAGASLHNTIDGLRRRTAQKAMR